MLETTLDQLCQLKLNGMASALQTQLDQPGTYEGLAFAERLQLLVDHEDLARNQRKQDRLTRAAQFKLKAYAKDIDYRPTRGLQQSQMASLLMCDWLKKAQNLLLTGPCGTGKTYIACALGHQACLKGFSVRYYRLSRLILALTQAKADGSYSKLLKAIASLDVLIIDDWGLEPLNDATRNDLSGSRYFCESLFWASQPNQAAKITRPLMPPAAPIRPRRLVSTQQGVETLALA
jgi:DNA replication protein DnaC